MHPVFSARSALAFPRLAGRAGRRWFEAAAFADFAAIYDFNNDRGAMTTVSLANIATATPAELKIKRSCSFAEFFAFTAPAPTTARTFTAADGTIKNDLAVDAPRFTWINGKRQLRLENAATNLTVQSSNQGNAAWTTATAAGTVLVTQEGTSAFGDGQAWKVDRNSSSSPRLQSTGRTLTPATYVSYAIVKHGSGVFTLREFTTAEVFRVEFDLQAGTSTWMGGGVSGTASAGIDKGIITLTNGWKLCWASFTASANPHVQFLIPGTYVSSPATAHFYVCHSQCELSAFPTDPIKTTAAAVTRAIETARLSPLNEAILQRSAASVVVRVQGLPVTGNRRAAGFNASGQFVGVDTTLTQCSTYNRSVALAATFGGGLTRTATSAIGMAVAYDATGRSVCGQGGTVTSDANAISTAAISEAYLGRGGTVGTNEYGDGFYDFIGIIPERVSNTSLQALAVAA